MFLSPPPRPSISLHSLPHVPLSPCPAHKHIPFIDFPLTPSRLRALPTQTSRHQWIDYQHNGITMAAHSHQADQATPAHLQLSAALHRLPLALHRIILPCFLSPFLLSLHFPLPISLPNPLSSSSPVLCTFLLLLLLLSVPC